MKAQLLRLAGLLLWLAGLGIVILLVRRHGLVEIAAAIAVAGWAVFAIAAFRFVILAADAVAWRQLLPPERAVSLLRLMWARWIGESVNDLLPTAKVGGELLRGWLAHRRLGLPGAMAGASVVVDLTAIVAMQVLFTLLGLALLLLHGADDSSIKSALIGVGLLVGLFAAFLLAQGVGVLVLFERLAKTVMARLGWTAVASDGETLDAARREIYGRRRRLLACAILHFLAWAGGTVEIWLGLWALGHPVPLRDALMLESLIQAVRGAAFFMPGALGVQESGLILLGAVIGLGPEVALSLSLIKRLRELLIGLPGLVAWQLDGLRRQFRRVGGPAGD